MRSGASVCHERALSCVPTRRTDRAQVAAELFDGASTERTLTRAPASRSTAATSSPEPIAVASRSMSVASGRSSNTVGDSVRTKRALRGHRRRARAGEELDGLRRGEQLDRERALDVYHHGPKHLSAEAFPIDT